MYTVMNALGFICDYCKCNTCTSYCEHTQTVLMFNLAIDKILSGEY